MLGSALVELKYGDFCSSIPVLIVKRGKNIIGRDVLNQLTDNFVLNINTYGAELTLKDNSKPVFCKPRTLPFSMREKVRIKLEEMVNSGSLKPISTSEWGTPIVVVNKPNGDIRICGDYKVTLNPLLENKVSTTSNIDDLLMQISKSKIFTRLDLANAYLQIPLSAESIKLTTLTTPFGMYAHTCLPFGIKNSPAIFQNYLDKSLAGIEGCLSYQDDIIIFADDKNEHDKILEKVNNALNIAKLKVNENKCEYNKNKILYLGHMVSFGTIMLIYSELNVAI